MRDNSMCIPTSLCRPSLRIPSCLAHTGYHDRRAGRHGLAGIEGHVMQTPEERRAKKKACDKAYRETHKDKKAAYRVAAWQKANPDKCRDINARRRALKRGATVDPVSRAVVFERDRGICHLCGKRVDPKDWHLDHIVPLSQGGEHSYKNVAVSHPTCNMRKHNKIRGQFRLF